MLYTSTQLIDIDGDGDLDLATWCTSHYECSRGRAFQIYRNDGTNSWLTGACPTLHVACTASGLTQIFSDQNMVQSAIWADIDGDGDLDAYVTHALTFQAGKQYVGLGVRNIAVHAAGALYRNDYHTFTLLPTLPGLEMIPCIASDWIEREGRAAGNDYKHMAAFGDYNGDGRIDLLVAGIFVGDKCAVSLCGNIQAYCSTRDGWAPFWSRGPKDCCGPPTNFDDWDPNITNWIRRNDGTTQGPFTCWEDQSQSCPAAPTTFRTHLYRNDGDGRWTDVTEGVLVSLNHTTNGPIVMWVDLDADGDLDVLHTAWNGDNKLFENLDGNGTFAERTTVLSSQKPTRCVAIGDYDGAAQHHSNLFASRGKQHR